MKLNLFKTVFTLSLTCVNCCLFSNQTSTTDVHSYTEFCERAAKDPSIFTYFRRNPIYVGVVESVSDLQGKQCLDFITKKTPKLLNYFDKFKTSDAIGNPVTYSYQGIGSISPTTLRYIKIAAELQLLFGSLDGCSIIEIGGGYGGQCKIISDLFQFKHYTIVDLSGPILLTEKYLSSQGVQNVSFITPNMDIQNNEFDIVISNYAFSECTYEMQKQYVENIISKSKKGYLTCNILVDSHDGNSAILQRAEGFFATKGKIQEELTNANISWKECPEIPNTAKTNYLLIWGTMP